MDSRYPPPINMFSVKVLRVDAREVKLRRFAISGLSVPCGVLGTVTVPKGALLLPHDKALCFTRF